jgi:hypothetical protein
VAAKKTAKTDGDVSAETLDLSDKTTETGRGDADIDVPETSETPEPHRASTEHSEELTPDEVFSEEPSETDASAENVTDDLADDMTDQDMPDQNQTAPEDEPPAGRDEPSAQEPAQEPERVVERVVEKRGGFAPALFGGIVAAGLGFAAGISDVLSPYLPATLQRTADTGVTADDLTGLQEQIASLQSSVEGQAQQTVDLTPIEARLDDAIAAQTSALTEASEALSARIDALEGQMNTLAQAPVSSEASDAAVAAYEAELAAVQQALATQRAEVEAMLADAAQKEADAEAAAQAAQAQAALTRLLAALETGAPFGAEIATLQSSGIEVPAELSAAADGVATMDALQAGFPALARNALATARSEDGAGGGVAGFLQRQLGARSVAPREGDDADAILSRAEADVRSGDIPGALEEISALPDAARSILADWVTAAAARSAAKDAATALTGAMQTN